MGGKKKNRKKGGIREKEEMGIDAHSHGQSVHKIAVFD